MDKFISSFQFVLPVFVTSYRNESIELKGKYAMVWYKSRDVQILKDLENIMYNQFINGCGSKGKKVIIDNL